jgi:heme exporter protein D
MSWGSAAEFFAMGGYAAFVWGSFGVVLACLIVEPFAIRARHRSALRRVKQGGRAAQEVQREAAA